MNPQGIYTLVSGGKTLERQIEATANNLANVSTIGYKGDQPAFQQLFSQTMGVARESDEETFAHNEFLAPYTGVGTFFVSTADMGKDFSPGGMTTTGNDLDFAIVSQEGFSSIATPQGERFTRAGNFRLNQDKQLVSAEGFPVNGKEGPIKIEGTDIRLGEDGSVLVDGKPETRVIQTGASDTENVEITSGLVKGDLVVLPGRALTAEEAKKEEENVIPEGIR